MSRRKRAARTHALATTTPAPGTPSAYAPAVRTPVTPLPRRQGGDYSWGLEQIRSARVAQLRGEFDLPVRMAEAFRTNDALFTAYTTRVSTQNAIKLPWIAADTDTGRVARERAERSVCIPQHVRQSILGTLCNHGVAVGYVVHSTYDDPEHGPSLAYSLSEWPLEHVRYNPNNCTLETRTREQALVTITHGDGHWVVFRKFGVAPWTQDACVLPGALVWAAHAFGASDWAAASGSHGQPKLIGTLAEGVKLQRDDDSGELSAVAQGLLNTLRDVAAGDSITGILPHGATAELLFNGSTAWQVFERLILNREKAAMRIYLGTDAVLGSQGGAPGVDIAALFNVASTRIQGDLEALERGYREGVILPWCAAHAIAVEDAPRLVYAMPDTDGEKRSEQEASALERLAACVDAMKRTGLQVTQEVIDALVSTLSISVPCTLAAVETRQVTLQLAPTDVAKVVTVNEARASQGLAPREGGDITIAEQDAQLKAASVPPAGAPVAPTEAPAETEDNADA